MLKSKLSILLEKQVFVIAGFLLKIKCRFDLSQRLGILPQPQLFLLFFGQAQTPINSSP
jgi:hypothetical protein